MKSRSGALPHDDVEQSLEVHSAERVASLLRQEILRGELRPGEKLKDLHLATRFKVSRNTMRDAIRQLTADGLVTMRLYNGSTVRVLSEDDARDIYQVRRVLELAAISASSAASEAQLRELEETVEATARAVLSKQWDAMNTATMFFHRSVVRLLGSPRTDEFFENILAQLRLCFSFVPDRSEFHEAWLERDRRICDLIVSGYREQASREMTSYLNDSEAQIIDLIRSARVSGPSR